MKLLSRSNVLLMLTNKYEVYCKPGKFSFLYCVDHWCQPVRARATFLRMLPQKGTSQTFVQGFHTIIPGKLSARNSIQYVCPLQHVRFTFCVAFSAITSTCVERMHTHARTSVAWLWWFVHVLVQTTKRASTQHSN